MKKALLAGIAIGLVVATFETVKRHGEVTEAWVTSAKMGLLNPTTLGAAAAAAIASFLL